jgi:hypothetical protein
MAIAFRSGMLHTNASFGAIQPFKNVSHQHQERTLPSMAMVEASVDASPILPDRAFICGKARSF